MSRTSSKRGCKHRLPVGQCAECNFESWVKDQEVIGWIKQDDVLTLRVRVK